MSAEYLTETENTNHQPDFNSQAQLQLIEFDRIISILRRKISHKDFADFNDLVYERREELRDQEYMDIMSHMSRLLPDVTNECKCSPDSLRFCNSGIDEFLYCNNYSKWTAMMPQIEFIRFLREHPSYSNKQLYEFLNEYCSEPLQIRVGVNPNINTSESNTDKYLMVIVDMLNLCNATPICFVGRALLVIMNFKFCLENIPLYNDNSLKINKIYNTIFTRCDILSAECVSPILQLLLQILGWPECPFKTIQKLMLANRHLSIFGEILA